MLRVRRLMRYALLLLGSWLPLCAQEACHFASTAAAEELEKNLASAPTCGAAAARLRECAWGSSADVGFASIVIEKCESGFRKKLPPQAEKRYMQEMKLCGIEVAKQDGTMYRSAGALCRVDVAARAAADPAAVGGPLRASFDCGKAHAPLERAICADADLGQDDIVLSRVYQCVLKDAESFARARIVVNEREWLQGLGRACGGPTGASAGAPVACLRDQFERRFSKLNACMSTPDDVADCIERPGRE